MEKTGEVRIGVTPCDICGKPATLIVGKKARCDDHITESKSASVLAYKEEVHIKSFTDSLEEG